jgi:nitrogen fixation protein NifB
MNLDNHPCFNPDACKSFGRVHLPVAPRCNIQCKFCNRRFDCVNETRPGVTSAVLSPAQAMVYLEEVFERKGNIAVVGIAGPGDPFANPRETLETLKRVRARFPEVILCVATNGLNLSPHLDELERLKVSHVTVTVNAVDPAVGAKIYSWMRVGKKVVRAEEGAALLLARQLEAIEGLRSRGIMVKVNSIILPGINADHIQDVARRMADLGVDLFNAMPYYPNAGSEFEHLPEPDKTTVRSIRDRAARHVKQMRHCTRCRADAVGLLGEAPDAELTATLNACQRLEVTDPVPAECRRALAWPWPAWRACSSTSTWGRPGNSWSTARRTGRSNWWRSAPRRRRGGGSSAGKRWPESWRTAARCWSAGWGRIPGKPWKRPVSKSWRSKG